MARRHTTQERLLALAQGGPVRARDLEHVQVPRAYLARLVEKGVLERLDRGLYALVSAEKGSEGSSLGLTAKRVPKGVVCLLSALQVHGLTTELPGAVWLMIDRSAHPPRFTYPRLEIVRASGPALSHGVERRTLDGVTVKLTTPAKTVADCFRYRRHVGMEVALSALRDYLRKYRGGVDRLVEAARVDRVYTFLRPYLEALA